MSFGKRILDDRCCGSRGSLHHIAYDTPHIYKPLNELIAKGKRKMQIADLINVKYSPMSQVQNKSGSKIERIDIRDGSLQVDKSDNLFTAFHIRKDDPSEHEELAFLPWIGHSKNGIYIKPRSRRPFKEISRHFWCPNRLCKKGYEKIQHLNAHLVDKNHGFRMTTAKYQQYYGKNRVERGPGTDKL